MKRCVIGLAKRRGMEALERCNLPEELPGFEESFVTGTGAEVTPVCEAGPYKFTPGAMSRVLIDDYSAVVRPRQKGGVRREKASAVSSVVETPAVFCRIS